MPSITINHDGFQRLCKRALIGDDQELAARLGVSGSTVSRVKAGRLAPSNKFIAGALQHFGPAWFHELFSVVDD